MTGPVPDEALLAEDDALLGPGAPPQVGGAAHDAAPQGGRRPDVDVVVDHGPRQRGVVLHDHVGTEDGVLADAGPGLDAAVVADDDRAGDLRRRVDVGALPEPDAVAEEEAGDVDRHPPVEDVAVGPVVGVDGADVLPVAVDHETLDGQPPREGRREHGFGEVDPLAFRDQVQDLRFQHVDAGVDGVGEDLAPRRLLQEPLDPAVGVGDDDAEVDRVLHPAQSDGGQRAGRPVGLDDGVEVDVGQHVAGDDDEGVVELGGGVADGAGRPEGCLLGGVAHRHTELGAVPEVVADVAGEEGHRDDDVVEAVERQPPHDVLHQGPVGHRHHRLRLVGGQGAEPSALATGHHDRLHVGGTPDPGHVGGTPGPGQGTTG
jgi:hypothetical protein